jgi:hypothetical protein
MLKLVSLFALTMLGGQAADFPHQIITKGLGYFPVAMRLKNGDVLAVIRGGAAHIGIRGRLRSGALHRWRQVVVGALDCRR